jgi:putative tryptophan/tyrosine transport system substrate-binding protein
MNRRAFFTVVGGSVLAGAPHEVKGQAPPRNPRVGYLSVGLASDPRRMAIEDAFRQGLHDLGYRENGNIRLETRFAEGDYARLPGLEGELVRLKVDSIVAYSTPAAKAALATRSRFAKGVVSKTTDATSMRGSVTP